LPWVSYRGGGEGSGASAGGRVGRQWRTHAGLARVRNTTKIEEALGSAGAQAPCWERRAQPGPPPAAACSPTYYYARGAQTARSRTITLRRTFKPHLDEFIDPMFRTTRCGHRLAEMAAINCVRSFQQMLGETIFAGRLNESQLRQLQVRVLGRVALWNPSHPRLACELGNAFQ